MTERGSRANGHLAVVTCMDARIDALACLGLSLGDAYVIRNAGGRVTDDVLRSLALATHVLGVESVIVMQHTKCGLLGVTEEELREQTAADLSFLPIDDHTTVLEHDIDGLMAQPYLSLINEVDGCVYDLDTGEVEELVRRERRSS
jgi:carbonic anhydrase